jgi:hypothetical protein
MIARSSIAVTALVVAATALHAQAPAAAHADSLLERLVGRWRMTGSVRGKPVTYTMDAARTLQRSFVELHMTDVARPPDYEARAFVGTDSTGRIIGHWLDRFGAAYSIPHATGGVRGDTLVMTFAYADGPFRDTFVYHRGRDRWSIRMESGDSTGAWRPFASYEVRRR